MAFEYLHLRNFQRHGRLDLELSPGITTLAGDSDVGKSSVVRALGWLLFNNLRGDSLIRHGEKTASARLAFDGGRILLRRAGAGGNLYRLGGREYKAFGAEVPEDIRAALNVSPNSFARQFDPHFWLSRPAGEVSRELNAIVDLSVVDSALSGAAGLLKRASVEYELTRERLTQAEKSLEEMSWVPGFLETVKRLEALEKDLAVKRARAARVRLSYEEATALAGKAERLSEGLITLEKAIRAGERAANAGERLKKLLGRLSDSEALGARAAELEKKLEGIQAHLDAVETCPLCGGEMNVRAIA